MIHQKLSMRFWILRLVVLLFVVILITRTLSRGDDFLVFYRVSRGFWEGVSPYDLNAYGNMVFKYPPWILPFFLPLGFLPLVAAKFIWGLVQALSLVFVVSQMEKRFAVKRRVQVIFLLLFSGVIAVHGLVGQVSLPLLALALAIDPLSSSISRFVLLAWAFSTKVITLFPFLHSLKRKDLVRALAVSIVAFSLLSTPVLFKSYGGDGVRFVQDWVHSMFSGTQGMNQVRIGFTTREAQGFPSLILRAFSLDESDPSQVLASIFISLVVVGVLWIWRSRRLSEEDQWLGWIALTPVVQPLAWFHFYIFAYPLLILGAHRAWVRRDVQGFSLFIAAGFLIGAVTEKTMGSVGLAFEMASVKSWGICLAVFLFSSRQHIKSE